VKKTVRLGELTSHLDAQVTQVSSRLQVVEKLESRVNGLRELAGTMDTRLAEQTACRAELDAARVQIDAVLTQTLDAHQKLEAVSARQKKLLPLVDRMTSAEEQAQRLQTRLQEVQRDEAALREQEARLANQWSWDGRWWLRQPSG
jgi:chromosome segregation ATPase